MKVPSGIVAMKDNPLTLTGKQPKIGAPIPDFEAIDNKRLELHAHCCCYITS
ncbi:hypothetical protein ACFL0M_00535 [Thermodesulfobacteriota bacterium]